MKWMRNGVVRLGPAYLLGFCTAAAIAAGCSKSNATATPVTIDDLKYPGDLNLQDLGSGKVILTWTAANNEKDFVGFNIYGMKATKTAPDATDSAIDTHADLGVTEGQAIAILGDDNKPSAAAVALVNKFDFDPAAKTPFEAPGTPPAAATTTATDATGKTATEAPLISARPITTLGSDGKPIYPTCQTSGATCALTTQANAANTTSANGVITFDLSTLSDGKGKLTVGQTYCFFVLSTMKGGTQVSAVTSSVACITPKNETSFNYKLPATIADSQVFDLLGWLKTCSGGTCSDPTASASLYFKDDSGAAGTGYHKGTEAGPLYFETAPSGPTIVAGKNNGILDLGYYADGFKDANLLDKAPTFSIDGTTPITINGGGYSLAGQSVPLLAHHMYVVATADGAATTAPTAFNYNWLYVNSDAASVVAGGTIAVISRLPAAAQ